MFDKLIRVFVRFFTQYPSELGVCPDSFDRVNELSPLPLSEHLAIQSVHDKFYFLLFGAIASRLARHAHIHVDLVAVRAINGAVGNDWRALFFRSAPLHLLMNRPWERAYGSQIAQVAYRSATWAHPVLDLKDWFRSNSLWRQLQQQTDQFTLLIDGVEVADLVVDSYLRFKPSPEFDVTDSFVRQLLWQALRDVRQASQYFAQPSSPRWYLTSYTTYLEHGIATRVALKYGVAVWSFGSLSRFSKKLSLSDSYQTPDFSDYKHVFDELDEQDARLELARKDLENRLSGVVDSATIYMRQSAYAGSNIKLPDGLNGAVVIFLHDFYDSPHVYPDLIFDDFWQWVCFTIESLKEANVHFFIKAHPNQIALSDAAVIRLSQKYPDLNWLSSEVSNVQLVHKGITCGITAYGTVAHELAYLGVPSICCARHPHYTFDFCRTARTKEEYRSYLSKHDLLPVSKDVMKRQALAFYYMHNLYGDLDEVELRRAFVSLWSVCNNEKSSEDDILNSLRRLTSLHAFDDFTHDMLEDAYRFSNSTLT